MSRYYKTLWREAGPGGPSQTVSPRDIQRRVDAALDADAPRWGRARTRKLRLAAVLTAGAVLLAGAALALNQSLDFLSLFFRGDTTPIQDYVEDSPTTVTDGRFSLTLLSSVTDGQRILFLVQIDALTEEAAEILFSEDFTHMDTFHLSYDNPERDVIIRGLSSHEALTARTATSRTFSMETDTKNLSGTLGLWLEVMSKDHCLEIPINQDMNVISLVSGEITTAPDGLIYILNTLSLTPIALRLNVSYYNHSLDSPTLNILFLKKDGTILSQGQSISPFGGSLGYETRDDKPSGYHQWSGHYTLNTPQDLSTLEAIIIEDRAFPLDGSPAYPADVDPLLYASYLPLGERMEYNGEDKGFSLPATALCDRLGAEWSQSPDGTVTATYRGVTLTLATNSDQVLEDGVPRQLCFPAFLQGGELYVANNAFDTWDVSISWTEDSVDHPNLWLLIP